MKLLLLLLLPFSALSMRKPITSQPKVHTLTSLRLELLNALKANEPNTTQNVLAQLAKLKKSPEELKCLESEATHLAQATVLFMREKSKATAQICAHLEIGWLPMGKIPEGICDKKVAVQRSIIQECAHAQRNESLVSTFFLEQLREYSGGCPPLFAPTPQP